MNKTRTATISIAPILAALLVAGCANQETLTERNFGESVRNMIQAQTYDPSTLSNPSEEAIDETDGQMLEGALESYRSTTADPDTVGGDLVISVGGGQR